MNILKKAYEILYVRSKKEIEYGPIIPCMDKTARIASELSNKEFTGEDIYYMMIAVKLARNSWTHKEDNLLDCITYTASLNDYQKKKKNEQESNN
tara:strand:- start:2396 stop:2680 length:285 start_codon:yes stop_codon:yes gene_type:complete